MLGLTATANKEMRDRLVKFLGMKSTLSPIVVSPNKDNIRFTVIKVENKLHCFDWIVTNLKEKKGDAPFTIIFCKTVNDIVSVLTLFLMKLGQSGIYVEGDGPLHERCLLGVYYSQTPQSHKNDITSSFEGVSGQVRVIFATTSLSMGVDFPHVKYVVHYGPSKNLTSHLQEAGRAGRDGREAYNITVYEGRHTSTCEPDVRAAVRKAHESCCRIAFLKSFDEKVSSATPMHNCCNVCHKKCKCDGSKCSKPIPNFDFEPVETGQEKSREVSVEDKACLKEALMEVQRSFSSQCSIRMFDDTGIVGHGLSTQLIDKIVSNVKNIFNVYDVIDYCNTPSLKIAVITLEVINEMFGDVDIPDELYALVSQKEHLHLVSRLTASLPTDMPIYDSCDDLEMDDLWLDDALLQ